MSAMDDKTLGIGLGPSGPSGFEDPLALGLEFRVTPCQGGLDGLTIDVCMLVHTSPLVL